MGEVYRAKDGKLGRDVAIKVLPDEFAQDDERLRRFQREAKLLASLNHPNIASIYGLEQSDYLQPYERPFDISPDGERFLMIKDGRMAGIDDSLAGLTQLIVVQHWFEELKARVPTDV